MKNINCMLYFNRTHQDILFKKMAQYQRKIIKWPPTKKMAAFLNSVFDSW